MVFTNYLRSNNILLPKRNALSYTGHAILMHLLTFQTFVSAFHLVNWQPLHNHSIRNPQRNLSLKHPKMSRSYIDSEELTLLSIQKSFFTVFTSINVKVKKFERKVLLSKSKSTVDIVVGFYRIHA